MNQLSQNDPKAAPPGGVSKSKQRQYQQAYDKPHWEALQQQVEGVQSNANVNQSQVEEVKGMGEQQYESIASQIFQNIGIKKVEGKYVATPEQAQAITDFKVAKGTVRIQTGVGYTEIPVTNSDRFDFKQTGARPRGVQQEQEEDRWVTRGSKLTIQFRAFLNSKQENATIIKQHEQDAQIELDVTDGSKYYVYTIGTYQFKLTYQNDYFKGLVAAFNADLNTNQAAVYTWQTTSLCMYHAYGTCLIPDCTKSHPSGMNGILNTYHKQRQEVKKVADLHTSTHQTAVRWLSLAKQVSYGAAGRDCKDVSLAQAIRAKNGQAEEGMKAIHFLFQTALGHIKVSQAQLRAMGAFLFAPDQKGKFPAPQSVMQKIKTAEENWNKVAGDSHWANNIKLIPNNELTHYSLLLQIGANDMIQQWEQDESGQLFLKQYVNSDYMEEKYESKVGQGVKENKAELTQAWSIQRMQKENLAKILVQQEELALTLLSDDEIEKEDMVAIIEEARTIVEKIGGKDVLCPMIDLSLVECSNNNHRQQLMEFVAASRAVQRGIQTQLVMASQKAKMGHKTKGAVENIKSQNKKMRDSLRNAERVNTPTPVNMRGSPIQSSSYTMKLRLEAEKHQERLQNIRRRMKQISESKEKKTVKLYVAKNTGSTPNYNQEDVLEEFVKIDKENEVMQDVGQDNKNRHSGSSSD